MDAEFWASLVKIIGVNIVLSGDNAVVIALASRSLPPHLRQRAVWFGAGGAVGLRLIFSFFIVWLTSIPYLKIVGALLLLWIGIKMLVPEQERHGEEEEGGGPTSIWSAVRTIIIADAVMSLDNVIAIAAAANDDILLIAIGLGVSVPLIIYGSTLILKYLVKYPIFVLAGAGLIGWIAGEIWIEDHAVEDWSHAIVEANGEWIHYASAAVGALLVVVVGKLIAARVEARRRLEAPIDLAAGGS